VGSDDASGISFASRLRGYLALSRLGEDARGHVLRTTDGGRTWRSQLVAAERVAPDGLAATRGGTDHLLAGRDSLLFTDRGGDRGGRSTISIRSRRAPGAGRRAALVLGRVRGAQIGARVLVSRRVRGESVWETQAVATDAAGRYETLWNVGRTSTFVARWAGDAGRAGDGSPAMVVRARR
jgi:hypothetical protein